MTIKELLKLQAEMERLNRERVESMKEDQTFGVFEIFPDGHKIVRHESNDHFDCEVWADQHKYDHEVINARSRLVVRAW